MSKYLIKKEDGTFIGFESSKPKEELKKLFLDTCEAQGYSVEDKIASLKDASIIAKNFINLRINHAKRK